MKLLGSTKDIIDADKNSENVPSLENVEVVLVHCNLVNNSYQQASRVLFTFVPNKQYGQLISISPIIQIIQNNTNYGVNKDTGADNPDTIKYDTIVLKPNLCDYAEAYILVDGTIRAAVAKKNCAPFTKCNLEVNDEHVDTAENLDITMPMYNLIEYSDNYQDSSATLYQYKRDEPPEANAINDLTTNTSSSFKYKVKL